MIKRKRIIVMILLIVISKIIREVDLIDGEEENKSESVTYLQEQMRGTYLFIIT